MLFEPLGEVAKWKIFYDSVKEEKIGVFLSYQRLHALSGFDVQNDRNMVYRANKELLRNHKKMLINVKKEGYKMGLPDEQFGHAVFRKIRARRQLDKGLLEAVFCDTSNMSSDEKLRHTHFINHLNSSLNMVRKRNVDAIKQTKKAVKVQENGLVELDAIRKQLASIEEKLKD